MIAMRIFAQTKANQQAASARSPIPRPAHFGQRREADSYAMSTPGDVFEQEADRVAEQVMRMPEPTRPRACACGGGCPRCRSGRDAPAVSQTLSSPGQPLDSATRQFMESRFGRDFSQVRVHTGPRADDAARAVQARAFASNRDLVFGAGQYDPHGSEGRRLLAHELTHVVQQQPVAGGEATHVPEAPPVNQRASAVSIQRQKAKPAEKTADDAAFWEWWKLVAGFEGPLEAWKAQPANKRDRGGETNWGVTKKFYMQWAGALGLAATEEGFAAMTPEQAMRFGRMLWKASGANRVKNTGVAIVLADWYWGGIDLGRFSALLQEKGRASTFNEGKPDAATIDFMNTLGPAELIRLMSKAKAEQYRKIVKKDPSQKEFLTGWLDRNERRRLQAQAFIPNAKFPVKPGMSLWERAQRVLREARALVDQGEAANSDDREIVNFELWAVAEAIDQKGKSGFAHAEEEMALKALKRDLLDAIGRLMKPVP
jgi:lysozyme family protein